MRVQVRWFGCYLVGVAPLRTRGISATRHAQGGLAAGHQKGLPELFAPVT
jgi:hypothetical protein